MKHIERNYYVDEFFCKDLLTDGIANIKYRGCYFRKIKLFPIRIDIQIKLFTKNLFCYHINPKCEDRRIYLSTLFNQNRYLIFKSMDSKNSINIVALILNEI